jgi:hypothetical protein
MPHRIILDLPNEELPVSLPAWLEFLTKLKDMLPGDPSGIAVSPFDPEEDPELGHGEAPEGLGIYFYAVVEGAEDVDNLHENLYDIEQQIHTLESAISHLKKAQNIVHSDANVQAIAEYEERLKPLREQRKPLQQRVNEGFALIRKAQRDWEHKLENLLLSIQG